ncbi:uncharacterized protein F5891DRAFT_1190724 [Suillus fuscotomentosus]|uniref:Uncharacterized protein n=1 Tax=Suillus fuscotomentosus TaxID=1912939 RepID=A0AAD4HKC0_9AGAM|nr:uncharacterized protein F5891DRAFT_1190724 [Suillus fuscotomentosus]KAG1898634.1 hypothetical protein F5891DRAFT_1190724 [Suillus fuscotomentosus]
MSEAPSLPSLSDEQAYMYASAFKADSRVSLGPLTSCVTRRTTMAESLESGGVTPSSVDSVVLIHLNWDHIGDPRMRVVSSRDRRDLHLRLDETVVEALVHALDVEIFKNRGWE